jgi:hypothetical protein
LEESLLFLESKLANSLASYFGVGPTEVSLAAAPTVDRKSDFSRFIDEHKLDADDQLLLLLALAPHIKPDLIDAVVQRTITNAGDYPQLGGVRGKQHRGFLPTGDTALFLLAGNDANKRIYWQSQLRGDHQLIKKRIIYLDSALDDEPAMSGRLVIDTEYVELFIYGKIHPPALSLKFPAQLLQTQLHWDDLVLPNHTMIQVKELETWVRYGSVLMQQWGMGKKLRPGLRVLFYGPPGTGKTFTATLLGAATGLPVYRVDLSMVVSKYIGETEKNLANLFSKAENKNWILFFDEADALFGKRTQLKDAHDRFANQEVSYLLQRVETYSGLVILASNLANNVDEAFSRRFEQIIHFPMPRKRERQLIWEKGLPANVTQESGLDFNDIANRYEISGGMIMNVIRYCCMQAIARDETILRKGDFVEGIRREYAKENRLD